MWHLHGEFWLMDVERSQHFCFDFLFFEPQLGAYHVTIILFGTMNTYGLAYMKANMN
jgi:hypothetical protein